MATSSEMKSMSTTLPPSLHSPASADKYRGAVVEDLQLPPAFTLPRDEALAAAIELAYDRDFSHIPVLTQKRRLLGYIDVASLKSKWEAGQANLQDKVYQHMIKFQRRASDHYSIITPDTPLAELEGFLRENVFALITDYDRKFVLAVATSHDLENFVSRRGF